MIRKVNTNFLTFSSGSSSYTFLPSGDIYCFENEAVMINGYIGSKKEGSANNIWLHIKEADVTLPLLGIHSSSRLLKAENSLKYVGKVCGISYEVTFFAAGNAWFWDISLSGTEKTVTLFYGQDLGMALKDSVLENELYAAQYLDHTILEDSNGWHICSRQNLPQNGCFPYLQQGIINGKATGYSTDALQFFGLSYKMTNLPEAFEKGLANKNLQFENSYAALQTEEILLGGTLQLAFFGFFQKNHANRVQILEFSDEIVNTYRSFAVSDDFTELPPIKVRPQFGTPYVSPMWTEDKITSLYPQRILEEREEEVLLSFFGEDASHIAFQQKELKMNRPHGNIISTPADTDQINNNLITSTQYIYGCFQGQTAVGNTSKHKLLSVPRGLMNLLKNSGQRIWISIDGCYRLLTMPSLFEVGLNYSRWFYEIGEDILQITSFAVSDETSVVTQAESQNGIAYDFIITNQLVMGIHEFSAPVITEEKNGILFFYPEKDSPVLQHYPSLHYEIALPGISYHADDDRIFFEDDTPQNETLLTLSLHQESQFQVVIRGILETDTETHTEIQIKKISFEREKASCQDYYSKLLCGFYLEKDGNHQADITKLNITSKWFAHNAMVHFAVPHGLEQPGGAAWGTRDICQGPIEFFFAVHKFSIIKNILLNIFSHQVKTSGEWPQWFMFDRYTDSQSDCHGDVVFWPLKCIGDYLVITQDVSILQEALPYADNSQPACLMEHIQSAVASIEKRFLSGTSLISYTGGDWDDTLQPAQDTLQKCLVSSWTQALAYQVMIRLAQSLKIWDHSYAKHLNSLAKKIKEDFYKYLIPCGTIAGFAYQSPDGTFHPMLHPDDLDTGIKLRLLPLTRSIIGELADPKLAARNMEQIENTLHFPDGVRLMDRPASYRGGVSHLFRRAEQAANIGREISLQYVHAHIRYIEALCKTGNADRSWHSLFEVNPICIKNTVPNAAVRQSNLYFSSSDGDFPDRYNYAENFNKLYDGSVSVKGGWRIYSSGPGIYLNRLICNILGIRAERNTLLIDPVLPLEMDGLTFHFECFGTDYIFQYHITKNTHSLRIVQDQQELPTEPCPNPYRKGGVRVRKEHLLENDNKIHIYIL